MLVIVLIIKTTVKEIITIIQKELFMIMTLFTSSKGTLIKFLYLDNCISWMDWYTSSIYLVGHLTVGCMIYGLLGAKGM